MQIINCDFNDLVNGMPGLTPELAAIFKQAAIVRLHTQNHFSGVNLKIFLWIQSCILFHGVRLFLLKCLRLGEMKRS